MKKLKQLHLAVALALVLSLPATSWSEEIDPQAVLAEMSETIAGLSRFIIRGDAFADAGLGQGQIIEHTSVVTARVMRPNALRITNKSAEGSKELYFVDGVLSISTLPRNFYAQTEIPNQIEAAVDFAMNELAIDAPLMDLLSSDPTKLFTEDAERIVYLGPSLISDALHHHIAIRNPELDIQLWVAADGPALPGKISITSRWDAGNPRFVGFMKWDLNPDIPSGSLEFVPPDGAIRIDFAQDVEGGAGDE